MSSKWRHHLCDDCWKKKHPERAPYRLHEATPETCCQCAAETTSGIMVRADPITMLCKGHHEGKE